MLKYRPPNKRKRKKPNGYRYCLQGHHIIGWIQCSQQRQLTSRRKKAVSNLVMFLWNIDECIFCLQGHHIQRLDITNPIDNTKYRTQCLAYYNHWRTQVMVNNLHCNLNTEDWIDNSISDYFTFGFNSLIAPDGTMFIRILQNHTWNLFNYSEV